MKARRSPDRRLTASQDAKAKAASPSLCSTKEEAAALPARRENRRRRVDATHRSPLPTAAPTLPHTPVRHPPPHRCRRRLHRVRRQRRSAVEPRCLGARGDRVCGHPRTGLIMGLSYTSARSVQVGAVPHATGFRKFSARLLGNFGTWKPSRPLLDGEASTPLDSQARRPTCRAAAIPTLRAAIKRSWARRPERAGPMSGRPGAPLAPPDGSMRWSGPVAEAAALPVMDVAPSAMAQRRPEGAFAEADPAKPAAPTPPASPTGGAPPIGTGGKPAYPAPAGAPTQAGPEGVRFDFNYGARVLVPPGRGRRRRVADTAARPRLRDERLAQPFEPGPRASPEPRKPVQRVAHHQRPRLEAAHRRPTADVNRRGRPRGGGLEPSAERRVSPQRQGWWLAAPRRSRFTATWRGGGPSSVRWAQCGRGPGHG